MVWSLEKIIQLSYLLWTFRHLHVVQKVFYFLFIRCPSFAGNGTWQKLDYRKPNSHLNIVNFKPACLMQLKISLNLKTISTNVCAIVSRSMTLWKLRSAFVQVTSYLCMKKLKALIDRLRPYASRKYAKVRATKVKNSKKRQSQKKFIYCL